jgi:NADH-quinone oxidoreductase subunit N
MPASEYAALTPVIIVAGWACLLLIVDLYVPSGRKGWTALLAAAGLLAALAAVLRLPAERVAAFGGMIFSDGFAAMFQIVFLLAGLISIPLAYDSIRRSGIERGEYYTLMLFSLCGMMLMAVAGDLIVLFLGLELLSIPLYVLAGFARPRPESEESAIKYFILGAFSSAFEVYGIALVFGATGTTRLLDLVEVMGAGTPGTVLVLLGAAMILVSLAFKVAAVPFHMWTPDVYQGAPSPVSAFMSVGAKAGGFAGLLRVFLLAFPAASSAWGPAAVGMAGLTMVWGNVAAIAQTNIKRMLAYSSIAHAGYLLMALPAGVGAGSGSVAVTAAAFYLFAYAFTNLGAWGVVIALEQAEGRGLAIDDYAGLGRRHPALALAMLLFMLSLTGLPPTIGFVGKFFLFQAAMQAGQLGLALVGVLTSLVSAYYYLRVVVVMYMRPGEPAARSEAWLQATVGLMAAATLLFGLLPGPLLQLASRAGLASFLP